MIPLSLRLRNFMCYTDVHEALPFEGMHVACISGPNGHGKSAILDAITWALWGECRARSADELIHLGETEMEVEFEFELGEGRYRVLRKRNKAGRGQTTLDLHVSHGNGLRPLTGQTVRDTQQRIVELLGMGYETFINSSFLLQGRADEFTVKPPGERKRILAEILELGRYDELEQRAREAMKARDEAARELERQVQGIEAELAQRAEREAEQAELARAQGELELALGRAQIVLQTLQERQARLGRDRDELAAVEARLADARRQLERLQQQAEAHRAQVQTFEAILTEAPTIDASYARLTALRAEGEAWAEKAAAAMALQTELARQQREVDSARNGLEATVRTLEARIPTLEGAVARRPELEAGLAATEAAAARYQALQAERTTHVEARATAQAEMGALEATNDRLREQFREMVEHRRVLAEAAQCPFCLSPLEGDNRAHAIERCERANAELTAQGKANNARREALQAAVAQAETRLAEVDAEAHPLAGEAGRAGALRQALTRAEQDEAELAQCRAQRDAAATALADGDYARDAQAALAALTAQLATVGYHAEAHAALRREMASLEGVEARHRALERAREGLPREDELLRAAETEAAGWRTRLTEEEARAEALRGALGATADVEQQVRGADAEVRRLEGDLRDAHQRLGAVRQVLAQLEFQAHERERLLEQRGRLLEERGIYHDLAQAFGKKGIQAMIIESVIPELEREANALLARMTDNRMHLKLETQRDTRQGNTIETLDIKLSDELGTRNYELFSGGEAFRANFALRIALSKLVAQRAGARMQLLVVDEGFGTQDAEGLERLIEAIKAIQDDFAKILIITHIPEMKEVFPARIEVRKTPRGSVFQVV
jgi:exonuclease SbcC